MRVFLLISFFISFVLSQTYNFTEYVQIAPGSFMQLTSLNIPSYDYTFNPGHIKGQIQIKIYNQHITSNQAFNMYIFQNSGVVVYPCVVNALMINSDPKKCYDDLPQELGIIKTNACLSSQTFDLNNMTTDQTYIFENCDNEMTLKLYEMDFSKQYGTHYVIIIENTSKYVQDALFGLAPLNLITYYIQNIQSSNQFQPTVIGICILIGLLLMLLISVLCIYNYKYQKLKEQNLTTLLVRGENAVDQKKKQKAKQN